MTKTRLYLVGSGLGLVIGFLSAYFYGRAAGENKKDTAISTTDFFKLALLLVGVIRQIAEIGAGTPPPPQK